jgi:hypothetical protein
MEAGGSVPQGMVEPNDFLLISKEPGHLKRVQLPVLYIVIWISSFVLPVPVTKLRVFLSDPNVFTCDIR